MRSSVTGRRVHAVVRLRPIECAPNLNTVHTTFAHEYRLGVVLPFQFLMLLRNNSDTNLPLLAQPATQISILGQSTRKLSHHQLAFCLSKHLSGYRSGANGASGCQSDRHLSSLLCSFEHTVSHILLPMLVQVRCEQ